MLPETVAIVKIYPQTTRGSLALAAAHPQHDGHRFLRARHVGTYY